MNREQAIALAKKVAKEYQDRFPYIRVEHFEPHAWVVDAIMRASAHPSLPMSSDGNVLTEVIVIDYTNHRGERADRWVSPRSLDHKETEWHPGLQWILTGRDLTKHATRSFAMSGIHEWRVPNESDRAKMLEASNTKG